MKASPISVAMLVVSLLLAPALLPQSPDSANQNAASPAPSASAAEVPRLIKFSGTLLDAQDRPLAGPVGVTFALYSQQTGGAALWLETQNVKPDASGVYTVLLGANSANGVPAELFASGEARWLEVQAERQAEQPRVLLVSVPYALKAKDAETLGGKPASAFVTTETLAGTGNSAGAAAAAPSSSTASTALPSSKAQTTPKKAASTPPPATACTSVTSDGTAIANSISLFTTACSVESSVISQAAGNVGIGTAAPAVALDVVGNNAGLRLSGTGTHQVTVTGATSGRLGQDSSGFFFASDTNGKTVRFLTNNGALNEWMRITSAGNVGIATTTPAQKLSVAGTIESTSGGFKFPDSTVQTTASHGGSVTSVGSGLGLTGGPITGSGTLAIDPTVVPQLTAGSNTFTGSITASSFNGSGAGLSNVNSAMLNGLASTAFATAGANSFTGNQSVSGNVSLTGNLGLPNTISATTGVITLGGTPFLHNFGLDNTFIGQNAGNLTMTGPANTASGFQALQMNTTGCCNTASGFNALQNNTTGSQNTASGLQALQNNTTGLNNTASGSAALNDNTTGSDNTATGFTALQNNTFGDLNTATGSGALSSSTFAGANTATGYHALYTTSTGGLNTATGSNALLSNTTGIQNTGTGESALRNNTTGNNNTGTGESALSFNTTGSNNTAIGTFAGVSTGNLTNTTAIGYNVQVNTSNKIRLGDSNVSVIEGQVAYTFTSDKNQKENFQPVEGEQVLRKIRRLTLTSWNYIGHDPKQFRHYGPVAQEFFGAFGHDAIGTIGTSTTINSGDMDGILMVAVQALYRLSLQKDAEIRKLQAQSRKLTVEVGQLRQTEASEVAENQMRSTIVRQQAEIQGLAARLAKLEGLVAPAP